MTEVHIVHPKIIERQKNPTKHIREDAARIIIEELERFKKKIPIRGLNNRRQVPEWFKQHYPDSKWMGDPNIIDRMSKLSWGYPYLPPQMFALGMTAEDFDKERAKSLMIDCLERLSSLHENLDSVTVIEKNEVENYKKIIWNKKSYLLMRAKMLGLVQYTEICEYSDKEEAQ